MRVFRAVRQRRMEVVERAGMLVSARRAPMPSARPAAQRVLRGGSGAGMEAALPESWCAVNAGRSAPFQPRA